MRNKLILASASPQRLKLLQHINIEPDNVLPADIVEDPHTNEKPKDLALRLAKEKAETISKTQKDVYILAADTVVGCGQKILDKAEDKEYARHCLEALSGRRHNVYGGIALITPENKLIARCVNTLVQFKRLTDLDIETYLQSGEWKGKAGGYAIQGMAESYIKYIRGSYSNVVGLSLYDTMRMLDGTGFIRR